jgi:hypothetical protein
MAIQWVSPHCMHCLKRDRSRCLWARCTSVRVELASDTVKRAWIHCLGVAVVQHCNSHMRRIAPSMPVPTLPANNKNGKLENCAHRTCHGCYACNFLRLCLTSLDSNATIPCTEMVVSVSLFSLFAGFTVSTMSSTLLSSIPPVIHGK